VDSGDNNKPDTYGPPDSRQLELEATTSTSPSTCSDDVVTVAGIAMHNLNGGNQTRSLAEVDRSEVCGGH